MHSGAFPKPEDRAVLRVPVSGWGGLGAQEESIICGRSEVLDSAELNSSPASGLTVGFWLRSVNACLSVTASVKWVDLGQRVCFRGWQTFSVKGQIVNMLGLWAILSLL